MALRTFQQTTVEVGGFTYIPTVKVCGFTYISTVKVGRFTYISTVEVDQMDFMYISTVKVDRGFKRTFQQLRLIIPTWLSFTYTSNR